MELWVSWASTSVQSIDCHTCSQALLDRFGKDVQQLLQERGQKQQVIAALKSCSPIMTAGHCLT
jgi:hypothetical protein